MRTFTILFSVIALCLPALGQSTETRSDGPAVKEGPFIDIDKSTQTLCFYKDGELMLSSLCATGAGITKDDTTPNGKHYVIQKDANYFSKKFKVPMPWGLCITESGNWIHAGKLTLQKGKSMPQSAGCIRLPAENAEKLFKMVPEGTIVHVRGDETVAIEALGFPILDLFEDDGAGGARMIIAGPNRSAEKIAIARKHFLDRKLTIFFPDGVDKYIEDKPLANGGYKIRHPEKCHIKYSFMPESSQMNLKEFQDLILTAEEKRSGASLLYFPTDE